MSKPQSKFEQEKRNVLPQEPRVSAAPALKQIKGAFLSNDKSQLKTYANDLETSLELNKAIIADLLVGQSKDSKFAIHKLNEENRVLLQHWKTAIKERDEAQARLLIAEQLVHEHQVKEETAAAEYEEKELEWRDQLSCKEYILQLQQSRFQQLTRLKSLPCGNAQLREALEQLCTPIDEGESITNVIEENALLRKALDAEKERSKQLEAQVSQFVTTNAELRKQLSQSQQQRDRSARVRKPLEAKENILEPDPIPSCHQRKPLATCQRSIECFDQKMLQLEKENAQLYKLNVKLSNALSAAGHTIDRLRSHNHDLMLKQRANSANIQTKLSRSAINESLPGNTRRGRQLPCHDENKAPRSKEMKEPESPFAIKVSLPGEWDMSSIRVQDDPTDSVLF